MKGTNTNIYETFLKTNNTVFTIQNLMMLSNGMGSAKLAKSLNYYVKCGKIGNPRRGIYTKENYSVCEMACLLYSFSYISLEYVLQRSGVIFQFDDTITCISYLNRRITVDGNTYQYRRINPEIFITMEGINKENNIYIATPERAFLDMIYLSNGNCYFDNLRPLNRELINKLVLNYRSRLLVDRVNSFFAKYLEN